MSIKAIGPKKWEIRVQWRDKKTGGKRSLTEQFEGDKRGAKSRHDALRAECRASGDKRQRLKLEAYARSWMVSRTVRVKPSVSRRYAAALDGHILPALGTYWLDRLDRDDVQAYVNARTAAGAAGNTVLNELRLLRSMARDATADDLCPKNWADRVTPPKVHKWTEEDPNLLSARQLAQVLLAVPVRWRAAVTLSAFTGLRWGELSALRWGDVDAEAGSIKVRRANWRGQIVSVKTDGSHRTVALPPPVAAMFAGKGKPGALLFPNRFGKLYKGWPLVKVMVAACAAAEVPYTTPHGLRRTCNNLLRKVAAAQVVKSITGHATDVMLEHYSIIGLDEKAEATRMLVEMVDAATTSLAIEPSNGAGAERNDDDENDEGGENVEQ